MLDLLRLKTFLVVAATSSFTRAGARLGYAQSSVTAHIRGLERELGAPLFHRFGKKVTLTEIGRQMIEYANRLIALAEEAKEAVRMPDHSAGPIFVGAPEAVITYRLPDVLHQFQTLYPHVRLQVSARSDSRNEMNEVLEGTLDLAVIVDELVHSDNHIITCPGNEEILLVKSPDYEFNTVGPFSWEKFLASKIILTDRNCAFRLLFDRVLSAARISLMDTMELGTIEAAKQCAAAGMGLAVLPKMALSVELKQRRLVTVPWPGPGFPVYLQIVRHSTRWISPALGALLSLTEQSLAEASAPNRVDA